MDEEKIIDFIIDKYAEIPLALIELFNRGE